MASTRANCAAERKAVRRNLPLPKVEFPVNITTAWLIISRGNEKLSAIIPNDDDVPRFLDKNNKTPLAAVRKIERGFTGSHFFWSQE